jgi:hypothetical protein
MTQTPHFAWMPPGKAHRLSADLSLFFNVDVSQKANEKRKGKMSNDPGFKR